MSDLKEFLAEHNCDMTDTIEVYDLGLFFWERGGKQFVEGWVKPIERWKELIENANSDLVFTGIDELPAEFATNARDFLDALDCLGEEKVKELIKELK